MKTKVLVMNGPNLNLLGRREPGVYGSEGMESVLQGLRNEFPDVDIEYFQSNHEGALIERLHATWDEPEVVGIAFNAGAYTHTSVALRDAIAAIPAPVVEVHISNVHCREEFRHHSMIAPVCKGVVAGFGVDSYSLAVRGLLKAVEE